MKLVSADLANRCLISMSYFPSHFLFPSYKQELSEVVTDVCGWWGGCVGVKRWTGEVEGRLVDQRPLAGSVDIVEEQRNSVQVGASELLTMFANNPLFRLVYQDF